MLVVELARLHAIVCKVYGLSTEKKKKKKRVAFRARGPHSVILWAGLGQFSYPSGNNVRTRGCAL